MTRSLSLTHTLIVSLSHTRTHIVSLSHAHTDGFSPTHTHTLIVLILSHSLSLFLPPSFSFSHRFCLSRTHSLHLTQAHHTRNSSRPLPPASSPNDCIGKSASEPHACMRSGLATPGRTRLRMTLDHRNSVHDCLPNLCGRKFRSWWWAQRRTS